VCIITGFDDYYLLTFYTVSVVRSQYNNKIYYLQNVFIEFKSYYVTIYYKINDMHRCSTRTGWVFFYFINATVTTYCCRENDWYFRKKNNNVFIRHTYFQPQSFFKFTLFVNDIVLHCWFHIPNSIRIFFRVYQCT